MYSYEIAFKEKKTTIFSSWRKKPTFQSGKSGIDCAIV